MTFQIHCRRRLSLLAAAAMLPLAVAGCAPGSTTRDQVNAGTGGESSSAGDVAGAAGEGWEGSWAWATGGPILPADGDGWDEEPVLVAPAVDGSAYFLANFDGATSLGGDVLTSEGHGRFVLARFGASGELLWTRQGSGPNGLRAVDLATLPDGSVYISGTAFPGLTLGSITLTSEPRQRVRFLARYDAAGNVSWVRRTAGDSLGDALADGSIVVLAEHAAERFDSLGNLMWQVDPCPNNPECFTSGAASSDGGAYLAGSFAGEAVLGASTISAPQDGFGGFLVRYGADGNVAWVKDLGASDDLHVSYEAKLLPLADGALQLLIPFSAALTLEGTSFAPTHGTELLFAKYGPTGELLRAHSLGGTGRREPWALHAIARGDATFVSGEFSEAMTMGGATLTADEQAAFLMKCSSSGEVVWTRAVSAGPGSAALLASGRAPTSVLLATSSRRDGQKGFELSEYDANGNVLSTLTHAVPAGEGWARVRSFVAAPDGSMYVGGLFGGSTTFGGTTLSAPTGETMENFPGAFIARLR